MKRYSGSIGITFLVMLFLFMSAFSTADAVRGLLWAAEPEPLMTGEEPEREQAISVAASVVVEHSAEEVISVPPPEAAAGQATHSAPNDGGQNEAPSSAKPKNSADKKSSTKVTGAPLQSQAQAQAQAQAQVKAGQAAPGVVEGDKQASAAAPAEKQGPAAPPLIDTSHMTNETAMKAVERNITLFKDRLKERFSVWLERSARYVEIMKDVLREKNLPEELVFLPIVESGFNLNAYSSARAVGPWQFIAATAKRYGLVIDWWRDERKDPVKSTRAAADYLKDLYKMFGSWNLALAAYNAGEGRIMRALKKTDTGDYWSLIDTKQLAAETREYVPRYIAATMIAHTPEEYGFENLEYHEPLEYDEVTIHAPLDVDIIARCAECTVKEIRELNPELRRWSTPPNVPQYTIRIPAGSKEAFQKSLASIPKEERFTVDTYIARKGDSVRKIAQRTGTPVSAILALNSLSGIERISAGEVIKLPPQEKFSADLDDRNDMRSLAKKAVYKKRVADKEEKKRIGKRGKKSTQKAEVRTKSKKAKSAGIAKKKTSTAKSAGTAKVKSKAKKSKVKTKRA